jgi:hypothetical protein
MFSGITSLRIVPKVRALLRGVHSLALLRLPTPLG